MDYNESVSRQLAEVWQASIEEATSSSGRAEAGEGGKLEPEIQNKGDQTNPRESKKSDIQSKVQENGSNVDSGLTSEVKCQEVPKRLPQQAVGASNNWFWNGLPRAAKIALILAPLSTILLIAYSITAVSLSSRDEEAHIATVIIVRYPGACSVQFQSTIYS